MSRSHARHRIGGALFLLLFTLAHAAVALQALRLWAESCGRRKRPR